MNSHYTPDFSAVGPAQAVPFSRPSSASPQVDFNRWITGGYVDTREGGSGRNGRASADEIEIIESPRYAAQRRAAAAAAAAAAAQPPKPPRRKFLGLLDETRATHPEGEHIAALAVPGTPTKPDPYASARHDPFYDKYITGGAVSAENLYRTYPLPSKPAPAPLEFGADPRDRHISDGGLSSENPSRTRSGPDGEDLPPLYTGLRMKEGGYIGALYPVFLST